MERMETDGKSGGKKDEQVTVILIHMLSFSFLIQFFYILSQYFDQLLFFLPNVCSLTIEYQNVAQKTRFEASYYTKRAHF